MWWDVIQQPPLALDSIHYATEEKAKIPRERDIAAGKCRHERTTCNACVSMHIREHVRSKGRVDAIECPEADCAATLSYDDVRMHAASSDFDAYDFLLNRRAIEAMDNFRWCARAGCGSGQLHDEGCDTPIMTCVQPDCGAKTCFAHNVPWHEGYTCAEYDFAAADELKDAAAATAARVLRLPNVKQCPKCKFAIEKNGGRGRGPFITHHMLIKTAFVHS